MNASANDAASLLRAELGADAVSGGDTTWRYSCGGVNPTVVASPPSAEATVEAVRTCAASGMAMVPVGGGGHLGIGWPPRRYDVALSLRRLNRVVVHEAGDMTVTAEAGVTLASLNNVLGRAGQWLPLDPPRDDEATIGGLIAADRNGPLRLAYGKVRDYLIGVRVVTAEASIVRGGGRVVKNVAGYDLPKLLVGSYGTLGAIIEATFKVRPRPAASRVFVWRAESIGCAVRNGLALLASRVEPVFAEAINAVGTEAIGLGNEAVLVVGCAGSEAEVTQQGTVLAQLAAGNARECEASVSAPVMKAIRAFSQAATEDALVARVSTIPGDLAALLERFESEAAARSLLIEIGAHAGNGVAWCQVHAPQNVLGLDLYAEWMRVHTRQAGGWVVFEHVPSDLRERIDPWGFNERSLPLMAGIKRALDPHGLFSPGRFVGRI